MKKALKNIRHKDRYLLNSISHFIYKKNESLRYDIYYYINGIVVHVLSEKSLVNNRIIIYRQTLIVSSIGGDLVIYIYTTLQ